MSIARRTFQAGWPPGTAMKVTRRPARVYELRAGHAVVRLRPDLTPQMWQAATRDLRDRLCLPVIDEKALAGLKFSAALPPRLAELTLAARLADLDGALDVLSRSIRFATR
jgi:ATP-dependent Lhr-like helicase